MAQDLRIVDPARFPYPVRGALAQLRQTPW